MDVTTKALLGASLLSVGGAQAASLAKEATKRPNLVFIFSDQQSYDMVGCYGNEQIITPNLDEFAKQGVRFNNCFSNCPISTPYRGMLMTGQHSLYNGTFSNDLPLIPGHGKKFGEVLRDAGYSTAYVGKWHLLGGDRDRPIPEGEMRYGFDEVFLSNNCHVDYRAGHCYYWNEAGEKVFFDEWEAYGQTHQAVDYLESRRDSEQPFALFVSWHPPHDWRRIIGEDGRDHSNYDAPEELMNYYNRDSIKVRPGMEPTPDLLRMYHGYMAQATGVDLAFGELMAKLKEIGADENTLVVFTSDHGDLLESYDAPRPKQCPHDYSARVPLLMRMPNRLKSGDSSDILISALDLMPTILGMMQLDIPAECQGLDLAKAIAKGDDKAVDAIPLWLCVGLNGGWRGVVTHDYTFSMYKNSKEGLCATLFDRRADPYQLNNLYNNPKYAKQQAKLKELTLEYMSKYNDKFYQSNQFIKLKKREEWNENRTLRPIDVIDPSVAK